MRNSLTTFGCIALSVFIAGCGLTALTSEVEFDTQSEGVVYNLPKTLLSITITQNYFPSGVETIDRVQFDHWCPRPIGETLQDILQCYSGEESSGTVGTITKYKGKHLPSNVLYAEAHTTKEEFKAVFAEESVSYAMTITAADRPDPEQRYVLKYQHNALFNDRLCIGRTASGLLSVIEYAGDDRTPDAIFNLVRTFTAFGRAPQAAEKVFSPSGVKRPLLTRTFNRTIDPWNIEWNGRSLVQPELQAFTRDAERNLHVRLSLDLNQDGNSVWSVLDGSLKQYCGSDRACIAEKLQRLKERRCDPNTVCYRTKTKIPVALRDDSGAVVAMQDVEVVNSYDLASVAVDRAFLVEKITKLYFRDGTLTGMAMRKPSEAQSATLLPINVITAALSTPVGLFSAAFTGDTATKVQFANELGQLKGKVDQLNNVQPLTVGRTSDTDSNWQVTCTKSTGSLLYQ